MIDSSSDADLFRLARRMERVRPSAIRELMKLMGRPGLVSLGGGLPSADSFPVEALHAALERVLGLSARSALQYASTEGHEPLREWVANRLRGRGVAADPSRVMITSGSQQGLDIVGRLMLEDQASFAVEAPTYLGALQAFAPYEACGIEVRADDAGPIPDALPSGNEARFFYLIPNFQNPSGGSIPQWRRDDLVAAARRRKLPLIEDDPYGDLWFDEPPPPPLVATWPEGTIYLGSFSKIVAPGLRLGYVIGPPDVFEKLVQIKQAMDLQTGTFVQQVMHEMLSSGMLESHLHGVRRLYGQRRDAMQRALETHMVGLARWTVPAGGMFFWLELRHDIDAAALMPQALDKGVSYVPGAAFFAERPKRNTLRLSFVTEPPEAIGRGVAALASVVRDAAATAGFINRHGTRP